jgi:hypothetical protein
MKTAAPLRRESVTPMTLYSFDDTKFRSRSGAFAALARLAAADSRLNEAVELYRLAIEEGEERWGPDSKQVNVLLAEIANVYSSLGEMSLSVFYRRRATCD